MPVLISKSLSERAIKMGGIFCAHRGLSALMPENTLPAFAAALVLGAQEIEFDVRLTKDYQLIVSHDATLKRISNGCGQLCDFTLEDLKKLNIGLKHGWQVSFCTASELFEYFANFICGHESEFNIWGDFFKKLCEYKRVEAPGSYLNNMPDGKQVDWLNDSKTDFQRKCKFTLCFESTMHNGFVTEKIMDAFYADTIPVYYGSPTVADIFNKDAFINVADYESFEAAIERIKELDQDDEKYLEMLRQPILVDPDYPTKLEENLGAYICHIFDQPLEQAYRRSRVYRPKFCDDYLASSVNEESLTFVNLCKRLLSKLTGKIVSLFRR